MEDFLTIFPCYGKIFRQFSILWKKCFHAVENSEFRLFSVGYCCSLGAVKRNTRRPLSTVERADGRGQEKRSPIKSGSALSRARCGCGVVARFVFLAPRSGIVTLSGAMGALRVERFNLGAVKKISED